MQCAPVSGYRAVVRRGRKSDGAGGNGILRSMIAMPPTTTTMSGTSPSAQAARRRIVLLGGFGMRPKATMRFRALPLGQALAAAGHDVTLVLPPWDCPEDAGRVWSDDGVRVVNVPLPAHGGTTWGTPALVYALVRAVRAARPGLVHLFQPKGYGGLAARLLRGVPLAVDVDDWEGAGGWNDVNPYSRAQRRLFAWQERDLPRHATICTVASQTLVGRVAAFGVPANRITYLPNALADDRRNAWDGYGEAGASEAATHTLRQRFGLTGPTVLLYTRFAECAPATVAAIFACVRERLPEARLLIVGGSEAARPAFAPFADAVTWAGSVDFDDLPACLRMADVALVPFADTPVNRAKCSVKTLDLLALGVPVVATRVGENIAMIRDGETGVLVPPDDTEAAASALVALLTDAPRRAALGLAARKRAWRAQTWAGQLPALLAAYEQALTPTTAPVRVSGPRRNQ